ncbi:hypothetical protein [Paracoccus sp. (in: a-proteobacteria)]|uniref:hypothetical protein n=1 Tax=Paracoccus sp. TaxID=267 RepID=UPI002590E364|nr:hypothetical protein [Paracoccus sp. (in: a-proteobacteria)]
MRTLRFTLSLSVVFGVLATVALGSPRLECTVTSPMKDQAGEGGYGFSTYSNLATYGDMMCLQHILTNSDGNTATKVSWYEPTKEGKNTIISVHTLPGCYDNLQNQECNCKEIPCQVSREFYTESFGVKNILSTAEFGIRIGQYSDKSIRSRNIGQVFFLEKQDDNENGDSQELPNSPMKNDSHEELGQTDTRYAILNEGEDQYSRMTTRLSGYPAAPNGESLSIDMYLNSQAFKVGDAYLIENGISIEAGFNTFFVAPISNARSGDIKLEDGAAAVSWAGFEPESFSDIFQTQSQLASLSESGLHKYEASRVGISPDAEIVIFMDGEIILEAQAPVYVGLE